MAATGGEPWKCAFPMFSKPKVLYHFHGEIQLQRIIRQLLEVGFKSNDILIVAGFQHQKIIDFLYEKKLNIEVRINYNWKKSASYTLLKATENLDDDFLLLHADVIRKTEFYSLMKKYQNKIFIRGQEAKFLKKHIPLVRELAQKYAHETRIKNTLDPAHGIIVDSYQAKSGVGLALIILHARDKIADYKHLEIDIYNEQPDWYITDLDWFWDTNEYKDMNAVSKIIYTLYSKVMMRLRRYIAKLSAL